MNTSLLVRHPRAHSTESLPGYMLRLTQENGYPSPWRICSIAGLKQSEIRTSGFRIEKLAAVSNQPTSRLKEIGFSAPPGQPRWARLLNHPVVPTELVLMDSRICPDCASELGFIEAHWHLRLMAVCPIHLRLALCNCGSCGKRLRWFRPGLLECVCGANLKAQAGPLFGDDTTLFGVLRAKVLGCDFYGKNPNGFPIHDLLRMNLRSLVALVRGLGKLQAIASRGIEISEDVNVVFAAAEALRDWPENFMKLMEAFADRDRVEADVAAAKQFSAVYRIAFKNKAINPADQIDFVKRAFVEFLANRWGKAYIDPKMLRHLNNGTERRFVSLAEFADRMGVQKRTARRLLESAAVPFERLKCGESERVVVDASAIRTPIRSEGAILRTRAAAKRVGLPVSVLLELRSTDHFEVRHLSPGKPGWHQCDIDGFEHKVLTAARHSGAFSSGETISLLRIMDNRHRSPDLKADIVRAILSGEIAAVRNAGSRIATLQIEAAAFERWLKRTSDRQLADSRTPSEAAKDLQCDRGCIRSLLQMGLLRATKTCTGLRIESDSILSFRKQYASLVSYANQLHTSTRGLMARCTEAGIPLLSVRIARQAGPQPFIRVSDAMRLVATTPRR
jgi:hypothetical protein